MLYFIWLPLLGVRGFISNYLLIDTIFLTIILNGILLLDFIIDLTKTRLNVKYIFIFFIFSFLIIILNKQALAFFNIMMAVYLLRNISINKAISFMAILSFLNIILFLFSFSFELSVNTIDVMPKGDAYNLGFNNTNVASFFFMINLMVIVLWIYLKNKLLTFLFLPLFYYIYTLTLSRSSFVGEIVFYFAIVTNYFRIYGFYTRLIPLFFYFLLFVMIYLSRSYMWVNELFTTRFFIYDEILSGFGVLNFIYGYKIPEGQPMDSSFFSLLFDGGVVYVLIFLYLYNCYYKEKLSKGNYLLFPFILFMLVVGFSENIFSGFNFLSIIFFKILYDSYERVW